MTNQTDLCRSSTVTNERLLIVNGAEHAGILTHRCSRPAGHEGRCKCSGSCPIEWTRFTNEK